jgi:NDP-sugar pyrophosphorylase family protein
VQAVILAAGRARRLGRLGRQIPKCMLSVGGKSLVEHVAGALALERSVTNLILVVGPGADLAASRVRAVLPREVSLAVVLDSDQHGEVGSLRCAYLHLDAEFVVSDANILYEASLVSALALSHRGLSPRATVGVIADACGASTHLRLRVAGDYARAPAPSQSGSDKLWVYTGVGVFRRSILDVGTNRENLCAVMARLVDDDAGVAVVRYRGFYSHVATPFCLGRTRRCWSEHVSTPMISPEGAPHCD